MPEEITLKNLAKSSAKEQSVQEEKQQEIAKLTQEIERVTPEERKKIDDIKNTID